MRRSSAATVRPITPLPIMARDGRILLRRIERISVCTWSATTLAHPNGLSPAVCSAPYCRLHDTDFAQATCGTIRLKLLKIGALVRVSVRRIKFAIASALSRHAARAAPQSAGDRRFRPAPRRMIHPAADANGVSRQNPLRPTETRKISTYDRALRRHGNSASASPDRNKNALTAAAVHQSCRIRGSTSPNTVTL